MNRWLKTLAAALSLAAVLGAQTEDARPAEDPAIKDKVEQLQSAVRDRRFERDGEAIALILELARAHAAGLHDKDSRRILDTLSVILTRGRLRKPPRVAIYAEAAKALEKFGKDGAKVLQRAYDRDRFPKREEDWIPTRTQLLRSLGKTGDEGSVEFLIEVSIRANESRERAASGEALGNFEHAGQDMRKEIAQALINEFAALESEARRIVPISTDGPQDFGPQNARARLEHIAAPWQQTLTKLTGESFRSAHEWQLWFNKARRENWER